MTRDRGARGVVLLYHRVARTAEDPYGLFVGPDHFSQQLDYLRRHADIVSLGALIERPVERGVAITFDDGYCDNAHIARRRLEAVGAAATFFVVSGRVGSSRQFWWDHLAHVMLRARPREGSLDVDVTPRVTVGIRLGTREERDRTLSTLHLALLPRSPDSNERFVESLRALLGVPPLEPGAHRVVDADELRELAASPSVEVGAHTVSHPSLSSSSRTEQRAEISGSRAALEALLQRPVRSFAYPFGEYSQETTRLVREAGFRLACTVDAGPVNPSSDPLRLPRHEVGDWTAEEFADRFERWMSA